jgi:hypothetical protein
MELCILWRNWVIDGFESQLKLPENVTVNSTLMAGPNYGKFAHGFLFFVSAASFF